MNKWFETIVETGVSGTAQEMLYGPGDKMTDRDDKTANMFFSKTVGECDGVRSWRLGIVIRISTPIYF
ncbi:hypothetical protein RAH42_13060 (plasmid) [Pyramidobacter sp. YE332]|uniref:hypothetical protein n=1 Tax=Pyramidobacter sp. YE332 TaxID=3068894 RepID=UPI00294AEF22|nr:hypothetical protein [Pyramidobacter sp. YE332]WOL41341.1 hypothetical protein RAH42_13060 [Pyramidobacter sp. YE332]